MNADERAALREAHRLARWTVRRDVPLCETCEGPFPCSTVRLLDALDAAEEAKARALSMYDHAFPDQHAGPCSHVACQMARTLRRTW